MTDTKTENCFSNSAEPRLVDSSQGSSVLKTIEYKDRFLYSKYNPIRSITSLIESLNILPGTLIIINSPGLWYGLQELFTKLPEQCELIAVECDVKLYELSFSLNTGNVPFYRFSTEEDLIHLDSVIRNLSSNGYIRRAMKIDFCAGVQFYTDKYNLLLNATTNLISSFWKNRITLTKLGKLYNKNIFRNLIKLPSDNLSWNYYKSINSPILVCGAGEGIESLKSDEINGRFFVLCVDAALSAVKAKGIHIHGIICEESQLAIEKMFIGQNIKNTPLFMDITSRPGLSKLSDKVIWYSTQFSNTKLLSTLEEKSIVKDFMTPNGSVGLTAVEMALKLRKDESVPVYVNGLDFSYSAGKTHACGTNPHTAKLCSTSLKTSIFNLDACFSQDTIRTTGKNNRTIFTTQILSSYAQLFINSFSQIKNVYDYSTTGIPLGISYSTQTTDSEICELDYSKLNSKDSLNSIKNFYVKTKNDLETVIDLLKNGDKSSYRNTESLTDQLISLLQDKDYLWLHFPDGFNLKTDSSYLKRIRAEIIYFIKQIDTTLNSL